MKGVKTNRRFEKILEEIKSVKIQGAENIAKAGIRAYLLQPSRKSARRILETRPTEPLMQNAIRLLLKSHNLKADAEKYLKEIKKSHEAAVEAGSKLIRKNMNVYTHCHSSTVIDILKYAKRKRKKDFVVYTTEVEPLLQGRKTAEDLAKAKIKVIISPDLGAGQALRKCDLLLFGADAFTKKEVINKIGTRTLARLAMFNKIPRYSCGISQKFANKIRIEMRSPKEVWNEKFKNVEVRNPAFDRTEMKILTGIVSEFGILKPKDFVKEAREKLKYHWS